MADYEIDPALVYVAGLSAGGAMAAVMAATYPDLYAAVGVHSGIAYGAARQLRCGLHCHAHGGLAGAGRAAAVDRVSRRPRRHRRAGERREPGRRATGRRPTRPSQTRRICDARVTGRRVHPHGAPRRRRRRLLAESWIVHGGGHAWYGGNPVGSYTDPIGPDASAEMVRFFLIQRRSS